MIDTVWVLIAGMLVFFMNLGFACVESGFCRAKNCVNILAKNFIVFSACSIGFFFLGWGLMFGAGSDWIGKTGLWMVGGADNSPTTTSLMSLVKGDVKTDYDLDLSDAKVADANKALVDSLTEQVDKAVATTTSPKTKVKISADVAGKGKFEKEYEGSSFYWGAYGSISWPGVPLWAKFFFQLVFAGTAATIVSGAVAERIKYKSFILFTVIMSIAIYPVVGHWIWGGGLLSLDHFFGAGKGLYDFAGSTVVHSVGGWAALAGIIVLGPRIGKFGPDGKARAIPGHNLTAATIGCFVLWFGWFGFNPGSTMAADVAAIGRVCVTTNMAAVAATITATITAWVILGKPDLGMTLNGALAGLVAITAPCMFVTVESALIIGAIAGVLVVLSVMFFDRIRIDDPVGATSVHLVNGVFGTICVGLFGVKEVMQSGVAVSTTLPHDGLFMGGGTAQLMPQVLGALIAGAYVFPVALIAWLILKYTIGIRVSKEEEIEGLDVGEHGNEAYHGFQLVEQS